MKITVTYSKYGVQIFYDKGTSWECWLGKGKERAVKHIMEILKRNNLQTHK